MDEAAIAQTRSRYVVNKKKLKKIVRRPRGQMDLLLDISIGDLKIASQIWRAKRIKGMCRRRCGGRWKVEGMG